MTPRTALAEVYGAIQADDILAALKRAGLVIVDKGAIGRAQREAVRQWEEDNDNRPSYKDPARTMYAA